MSGFGMFGEGGVHGNLVSAHVMSRRQPRHGTTANRAGSPEGLSGSVGTSRRLSIRASSPSVMPWRSATDLRARKLAHPSSTTAGPSTTSPPTGFGSIEDDDADRRIGGGRGDQHVVQRPKVSVKTRADVLHVEGDHVHVRATKHGDEVGAGLAVDVEHGETRAGIEKGGGGRVVGGRGGGGGDCR